MKRGGESTSFRISHWLTSLLPDSYSKNFLILSPFVRSRQAMVFCITRAFQLCVQRGEGAAEHPILLLQAQVSSIHPNLTWCLLSCWDLAQFWMHIFDKTTETFLFSVSLSNDWAGREGDKIFTLERVWGYWVMSVLHWTAPDLPEIKQETLSGLERNDHSWAAVTFVWDVEKWWHHDVHMVIHNSLTPCPLCSTSNSLSLGLEIAFLSREASPAGVKSYIFPGGKKSHLG